MKLGRKLFGLCCFSSLQKKLNGIQSLLSTALWLCTAQQCIRERRGMTNTWSLYTLCSHRKEEKPPLLFPQHKVHPNKQGGFLHSLIHPSRTQQGHYLATIKYGKITIISRPWGRFKLLDNLLYWRSWCNFTFPLVLSSSARRPWEPSQEAAPLSFSAGWPWGKQPDTPLCSGLQALDCTGSYSQPHGNRSDLLIRQYQPATVLLTGNYMYKTLATAICSLALYGRIFFYTGRVIIILAVEEAFGVCYVVKFTVLVSLSWLGPCALWLSCCFLLWFWFPKFKVSAFPPQYRFLLMFLIFS